MMILFVSSYFHFFWLYKFNLSTFNITLEQVVIRKFKAAVIPGFLRVWSVASEGERGKKTPVPLTTFREPKPPRKIALIPDPWTPPPPLLLYICSCRRCFTCWFDSFIFPFLLLCTSTLGWFSTLYNYTKQTYQRCQLSTFLQVYEINKLNLFSYLNWRL